jgi:hypothetical protein
MNSNRKISLAAGVIYVITFASVPTLSLYTAVHGPNFMLGFGSETEVIVGGILEIIVAFAGIGTAVVLYPVLRKQNQPMALGLVTARIVEAGTIFGGVAALLTVVSLRHIGTGDEVVITGRAFVLMYDRFFMIGQGLMPAIDDILLGLLLYHSRLIPRPLAVIGIIGGPILLVGEVSQLFGVIGLRDPITMMSAIPVAFFELTLGIWLIVKGFTPSALEDNKLAAS